MKLNGMPLSCGTPGNGHAFRALAQAVAGGADELLGVRRAAEEQRVGTSAASERAAARPPRVPVLLRTG